MSEGQTFRIGLTMAGAISAGAYTAGVFDFLIHAQAAWEKAKAKAKKDAEASGATAPTAHSAPIVAMTGASAGGMTAVLGTIALAHGLQPTRKITTNGGTIECVLPGLYSAWVEQVRMTAPKGEISFLSLDDINNGQKVLSILNSNLLNKIRENALQVPSPKPDLVPYDFLSENLHIYVTVTNMRGIQYDISFETDSPNGKTSYRMLNHGDRKHYAVTGLGCNPTRSAWADDDPSSPLQAQDLNTFGEASPAWSEMGDSALATGAFPVGLAARKLTATQQNYDGRKWPTPTGKGGSINPSWPPDWNPPGGQFGFVAVDGGVIDNEPFELARYAIKSDPNSAPQSATDADHAVIMVAPFPEGYAFPQVDSLDNGLAAIITALIPTLIQQARFKLDELVAAADPSVRSRFLIAPHRDGSSAPSSSDIACGLLGGFGGFLDQSFREHDFQLGQRNCQQFLRKYFTLPATNSIVDEAGKGGISGTETPIIPLSSALEAAFNALDQQIPQPDWPRMSIEAYQILVKQIKIRASKIVPALVKQQLGSGILNTLISILWNYVPFISIKDRILNALILVILADLIRRDQIQDGLGTKTIDPSGKRLQACSAQERAVLACLADPSFELRTVPGIARDTGLPTALVSATLVSACTLPDQAIHKAWQSGLKSKSGNDTYTLYSRRLSWWERNFDTLSID